MSDPVAFRRPTHSAYAAYLAVGLASSVLYLSIFLSFAFLLPIQIVFGRYDWKQGLVAAGISAAGIAGAIGWKLAASGTFDALGLAVGLLPPVVLLAAISLMNAPFARPLENAYRALAVTALCAFAALPLILALGRDESIAAYLADRIGAFLSPLTNAAGEGYEASALAAALDPKELVSESIEILRDSFAAMIFLFVGGSWRIGSRLAGKDSPGRSRTVAIDEMRLPYPLIWAFLASWFMVMAAVLAHAPVAVAAFAWNCALTLSLGYAAQGLGVLTHLFKSWNMPRSLRILTAIMAVMALATPTIGIVVALALPLFGVTEIWIPYRKPKGVGA
jgi:hypothetical protein